MGHWLVSMLVALNQLANAVLGGHPDESISSRLGTARQHGSIGARFACAIIEHIDFHDRTRPDHCDLAVLQHIERVEKAAMRAEDDYMAHPEVVDSPAGRP